MATEPRGAEAPAGPDDGTHGLDTASVTDPTAPVTDPTAPAMSAPDWDPADSTVAAARVPAAPVPAGGADPSLPTDAAPVLPPEDRPAMTPEPAAAGPADPPTTPWDSTISSSDVQRAGDAVTLSDERPDSVGGRQRDTSADDVVAMSDVSRKFGDRVVVRGVNLTVPRGTILGIIGPSGAGKTTTIRMLTGGIQPTSGDVRVLGRPPKAFRRSDRERIGYMPQLFTLYEDLTAGENVDFVASLFGMLFRRRRRRVREVLKVVDLWDARGRVASKLSGGMQRRLELACALVHEPELIILDEPTAGIDPLLRGTIWDELHRLRDAGRTLLVTTQHVAEAEECDAVALIVGGEIIALAPPDELRRSATNGDLLDVQTATVFDGSDLVGQPGVKEVTQDSPRHFRITVDDAGTALPQIVERIRSKGVEIESAQENRLSFDEIFAILVARHGDRAPTAPEDRPSSDDDRGRAAA